jgi:methylamine---corrinoid protein Co-methyltransferase
LTSPFTSAGPATEMCFLETAAAVTTIVTSGSNLEALITHGGATTDLLNPQSAEFAGEVAHAVAGMTRADANQIVLKLLERYEGRITAAPRGKTYHESYDVKTGRPRPETQEMYDHMQQEIAQLGIGFK